MKDLNYDPQTQTAEDIINVLTAKMCEEGEKYATLEDADEKTKCLEKIREFREVIVSLSPQPDDTYATLQSRQEDVVTRFRRRTYL